MSATKHHSQHWLRILGQCGTWGWVTCTTDIQVYNLSTKKESAFYQVLFSFPLIFFFWFPIAMHLFKYLLDHFSSCDKLKLLSDVDIVYNYPEKCTTKIFRQWSLNYPAAIRTSNCSNDCSIRVFLLKWKFY